MSYSKIVKSEIIKKNISNIDSKYLLQGLALSTGSLLISDGKLYFILSNENEDVINFARQIIEKLFDGVSTEIVKVVKSFKHKERFELSITSIEDNDKILKTLGIISVNSFGESDISCVCDKSYLKTKETMVDFLTGLFLGSGTISVPNEQDEKRTYGYHLEIVLSEKNQADILCEILSNFDIFPKQIERNEMYVVYLKNCDTICDVLSLFGANKTVLDLLNQRVSRDMNNTTNRQMNCITANIDKALTASVAQMKAIEIIQNTIGLENLPENLMETALVRLANPESPLKELLVALDNKISKSALSQRFNKIIEIANELGDNNVK